MANSSLTPVQLLFVKVDPSHLLGHQPGRLWSEEPSEGIEFLPLPLEVGVGGLAGEEDNPSGDKGMPASWVPGRFHMAHKGQDLGSLQVPASGDSPDTRPGLPQGWWYDLGQTLT